MVEIPLVKLSVRWWAQFPPLMVSWRNADLPHAQRLAIKAQKRGAGGGAGNPTWQNP